jgi:hypothetical protein
MRIFQKNVILSILLMLFTMLNVFSQVTLINSDQEDLGTTNSGRVTGSLQVAMVNSASEDLGVTNSGRVTGSFAAGAGSDRIMLVSFTSEDDGNLVTGMSYGGMPLTSIGTSQVGAGWYLSSQLFYLLESDIADVSPATITISTDGAISYGIISVVFLGNVDQTTRLLQFTI